MKLSKRWRWRWCRAKIVSISSVQCAFTSRVQPAFTAYLIFTRSRGYWNEVPVTMAVDKPSHRFDPNFTAQVVWVSGVRAVDRGIGPVWRAMVMCTCLVASNP
jgi:hypothetical protein